MQEMSNPHFKIDENFAYLELILKRLRGSGITSLKRVLSGQVNAVYLVNGEYIIRLSDGRQDGRNFQKEAMVIAGIAKRVAVPEIILVDCSQSQIPFDVIVSRKKPCDTLARKWLFSANTQKRNYVRKLCDELKKLHKLSLEDFSFLTQTTPWQIKFQKYIENCFIQAEADDEIDQSCVAFMKEYFVKYRDTLYYPHTQGLIHGDIHFENVLVNNDDIQALLDFEYADIAPLDFELAKIINFCLSPQKFVEIELENQYSVTDLTQVIRWVKKYYTKLFDVDSLVERQRIYLIPDVLWGFKWAHISKISHECGRRGRYESSAKLKSEQEQALRRYQDIYFNQTLEKLLF